MIQLKRTSSEDKDFIALVSALDKELAIRDGDDHEFYHQFNKIDGLQHAIVGYIGDNPVTCGAIKEFSSMSMEVKRMYTLPEYRGNGFAKKVLDMLENWAAELDYERCVLETGLKQPEAIALYERSGYERIPNYGQYIGIDNSRCFEKILNL